MGVRFHSSDRVMHRAYGGPFGRIDNIVVGITAAPRKEQTLDRTYNSLLDSGFDKIVIFAEPDTEVNYDYPNIVNRVHKLGEIGNWIQSVRDLVAWFPRADCYGIVQDDVVFCIGVKNFLMRQLWPATDCGVASVFTPGNYTFKKSGWYAKDFGKRLWMAQAYFLPPMVAREITEDSLVKTWSGTIDGYVGAWCKLNSFAPYYHSPSLTQHIGDTSTLWTNVKAEGLRSANDFVGENFDLDGLTYG